MSLPFFPALYPFAAIGIATLSPLVFLISIVAPSVVLKNEIPFALAASNDVGWPIGLNLPYLLPYGITAVIFFLGFLHRYYFIIMVL